MQNEEDDLISPLTEPPVSLGIFRGVWPFPIPYTVNFPIFAATAQPLPVSLYLYKQNQPARESLVLL